MEPVVGWVKIVGAGLVQLLRESVIKIKKEE